MVNPLLLPLVFAAVILIAVFLALMLTRSGAEISEELPARTDVSRLSQLSVRQLADVVAAAFEDRGYGTLEEVVGDGAADLTLERPDPMGPQRWYIRCVKPGDSGVVESAEVRNASDRARGENFDKAAVVTTGGFSDNARLAATETSVLLIDGLALDQLVAQSPGLSDRFGLGTPAHAP